MLWGLSGDPPFDSIRRELARRRAPHVAFDQRRAHEVAFDLATFDGIKGQLSLANDVIHLDGIGALYVRPYDIRAVAQQSPNFAADIDAQRAAMAVQQRLFVWAEIADALVINRPSAMGSNCSKPYQASLIARSGFSIPPTLVTTTPDVAREFIWQHGQVIFKSVSDARSTVTRITKAEYAALDDVAHCPTQFQAYISGTDWRVHVVGDAVFASEIHCAADDYRSAEVDGFALDIRPAELPPRVAAQCHALAHSLGLSVAGIDLRRTSDDEWYCFEVNPAPAFTYYEQATGQPISAAVAGLLCDFDRSAVQSAAL